MGGKRHLSNNQKKRRILARRESDLLRALERGEGKVKVAAEEVKAARLRVLKMKRSLVPPCDGPHAVRLANLDEEIQKCLSATEDEIVQEYQRILAKKVNCRPENLHMGP